MTRQPPPRAGPLRGFIGVRFRANKGCGSGHNAHCGSRTSARLVSQTSLRIGTPSHRPRDGARGLLHRRLGGRSECKIKAGPPGRCV
eukprot:scaffold28520_cov124-Isochrysis_galbana.AAC.4